MSDTEFAAFVAELRALGATEEIAIVAIEWEEGKTEE